MLEQDLHHHQQDLPRQQNAQPRDGTINSMGPSVKAPRALRGSLAAVAAAAALALTGCATADTAAVVNGAVISESDAQEVVRQIKQAQPQAQIDTPAAVQALVFAPFINEAAAKGGKGQTDSSAKAALGSNVAEPTRATLEVVKASIATNDLTEQERMQITQQIASADIKLNPRYGTFDQKNLRFAAAGPNWIKSQR